MLEIVKLVHTLIFVVMASSVFYIVFCGISGRTDSWFVGAIILLAIEGVIFFGNGRRCPLTATAKSLGATKGYVFDSFFPEHLTRYTFPFFTSLLAIGLILWAVRH